MKFIKHLRANLLGPIQTMLQMDQASNRVLLKEIHWVLSEMKRSVITRERSLNIGGERTILSKDLRVRDNLEVLKGIELMQKFEEGLIPKPKSSHMGFKVKDQISGQVKVDFNSQNPNKCHYKMIGLSNFYFKSFNRIWIY